MMSLRGVLLVVGLLGAVAGCASPPQPHDADAVSTDGFADGFVDSAKADGDGVDGLADGGTKDGGSTGPRVTVCPGDSLPPPDRGVCSVTAGSAALLITGDVLTPGEVFRGGQVLVDRTGVIRCVGCDCGSHADAVGATAIVCPDGVVSPGLINAHDHLTYSQNRPYVRTAERYEHRHDWRRGLRGHTELRASGGATADQMAWGELRFVLGGATATNGSGGTRGFLRNLDRASLMEGLGQGAVNYQTFPLGDTNGTLLTMGCNYPSIDTAASIAMNDAYTPHVAEGIGPEARNEFLCIREGEHDLVQSQSAFIHGVGLLPPDIAEMARDGTALIWSPRSNITLYGDTARVTEYARLGVPIALGSDWIVSGSMNMLRELQCADTLNRNFFGNFFSNEALWLMVTRNAAEALAVDDVIGTLAVGKIADIAIFNATVHRDHRAVIDASPSDVVLVLRGGVALYGDDNVVAALPGGTNCDPIDVCGIAKRVCVSRDLSGRNFASLAMANADRYPLFFCDTPMDEPSCLPERNAMPPLPSPEVNGSTRYTGMSTPEDMDGDGIVNGMDNCPEVFNPIRPLDGGRQADFDEDGVGDACDPCPLDAGTTMCRAPDPNDRDGDGVPNGMDNCPGAANPGQEDMDRDGHGDVCDACPSVPNPGSSPCGYAIPTLRNPMAPGHPALGTRVMVSGAVVTGVKTSGTNHAFFIQDPAASSWGGVYVFIGSAMVPVSVGDVVTVTGTYTNFNGLDQIDARMGSVMRTGTASVPAPLVVSPADIATGGSRAMELQSMLVRVERVTAISATMGTDFRVTGNLIVTSYIANDTGPSPFPAMVGQTFSSITGHVYAFRDSKLAPRHAMDVVSP